VETELIRALLLLAVCSDILVAQESWLPRPRLPRSADTNDWLAYYDYGVANLSAFPTRADTAFRWAARLDPTKADPLFGRWVAFWLRDMHRFEDWLRDDPRTLRDTAVIRADSLYWDAQFRNPFVPQMLFVIPFDKLPGRWSEDLGTRGMLAYARLDYGRAADYFDRLIRQNPERNAWARLFRALTFVGQRAYDSAQVEMTTLAGLLRERAQRETIERSRIYESLELTYHRIGMLALVQGQIEPAREAFGHAIEENLAFYPAHAMIGDIALSRADARGATVAFEQAAQIAPEQAWIQYRLGVAQARMGRPLEAVAPLQRAISLSPDFADPYLTLGEVLSAAGNREEAIRALQNFLQRAPRRSTDKIEAAQRRLATLQQGP
jgi:tetratricopeptide (TPR) repeat protein